MMRASQMWILVFAQDQGEILFMIGRILEFKQSLCHVLSFRKGKDFVM